MTLVDMIFVTLVVAAFVGYGALLFTVWLTVEVLGRPRTKAESAPTLVEAERPHSIAA